MRRYPRGCRRSVDRGAHRPAIEPRKLDLSGRRRGRNHGRQHGERADVTYEELARRLREMGLEETKVSIASKLSRGGFGATFFIAAMKAIGRQMVNLEEV